MSEGANTRQVGGTHYKTGGEEHWDRVHRLELDYFQGQITKYVERCWKKNGLQDLEKARHFLDKYIELHGGVVKAEAPEEARVTNVVDSENHSHPTVRDYGAEVKPTGWVGYTFEGADGEGFLFTCEHCNGKFRTSPHLNPNMFHKCA